MTEQQTQNAQILRYNGRVPAAAPGHAQKALEKHSTCFTDKQGQREMGTQQSGFTTLDEDAYKYTVTVDAKTCLGSSSSLTDRRSSESVAHPPASGQRPDRLYRENESEADRDTERHMH